MVHNLGETTRELETRMERQVSTFFLELQEQLDDIPDPRRRQGRRYPLVPLLLLLILGFLRGRKHVREILETAREDRETLAFLRLDRVPAAGTYTNLFQQLRLGPVNRVLRNVGLSLCWRPRQLALDGKTVKGSLRDGLALQVVNGATTAGVVLALAAAGPAGGELPAAERLVEESPLDGTVLTGDALYLQRRLCSRVVEKGGPGCSS